MAHRSRSFSIGLVAIGYSFHFASRFVELEGDADFAAGNRIGALGNHLLALLLLLIALGCFIYAGVTIIRRFRGGGNPPSSPPPAPVRPTTPPEPTFDPDAIMARYLAQRKTPPADPPRALPGSFGRKPM